MTLPYGVSRQSIPRRQADQIVRIVTQEGASLRGALLGSRREGKTDLLRQIYAQLFERGEGPIPFYYSFSESLEGAALARHFVATFCQQVRAFLMREEEMVLEPVAGLESELEKAGLPLVLTEMARSFLATPPERQLEFAATIPEQFLRREDRPLCLLWDDAHTLDPNSPLLTSFSSTDMCWLVTGVMPLIARMAGNKAWPIVRLEPLSRDEAVAVAERACRMAGVGCSRETWEQWCDLVGTSPWLISSLVSAAETSEESLNSIEQLGAFYFRELSSGALGNWLTQRFERALPERRERSMVSNHLAAIAKNGNPSVSVDLLGREVWEGLLREEWAEDTAAGPRFFLDAVQRDWLNLVTAFTDVPMERSRSRAFQDFLLRVRLHTKQRMVERLFATLRSKLHQLPNTGLPKVFESQWFEMHPPHISSLSVERSGNAQLHWCHGFRNGGGQYAPIPSVLLIVLCEESPTSGQLEAWRRQLEREARNLPRVAGSLVPQVPGIDTHHELWLLVPPGTPLQQVRSERRFPWDAFERLLDNRVADQTRSA